METKDTNSVKREFSAGSALILAVVLTSLLAILGMMFVMVARVDRISTSAISENRELDSAVEAVVARISQELVLDVPGMPKGKKDYYDYPGERDRWLASLEPYDANPAPSDYDYHWRQISDVYNTLGANLELAAEIIPDYQDSSEVDEGEKADADGDGVADSKWVELEGINSNKGRPIFAAIRVIDNGGMLNVNTAYKFDSTESRERIDGSRLAQIHMLNFVKGVSDDVDDLHRFRCDGSEPDLLTFNEECAIRIENPDRTTINYLPYDIGDELELRNRFVLDAQYNTTRIEAALPKTLPYYLGNQYRNRFAPIDTSDDFSDWEEIMDPFDPDEDYNFRHLLTTCNFDRIIRPDGGKMLNVNDANAASLYGTIKTALRSTVRDANDVAAQVAVNLRDFRDEDSDVTTIDVNNTTYYGFERPCVYISELTHTFVKFVAPGGPIGAPPTIYKSYAIELYMPYPEDNDPCDWRLVIGGPAGGPIGAPVVGKVCGIDWSSGEQFHVIRNENLNAPLPSIDSDAQDCGALAFDEGDLIELQRRVVAGGDYITVDSEHVPKSDAASGWLVPEVNGVPHSFQRDITLHKCIMRLWDDSLSKVDSPTLGAKNNYFSNGTDDVIQAHSADEDFKNIGEIGMLFRKGAYYKSRVNRFDKIGYSSDNDVEDEVRLDLADPNYHGLFKYLTVFDPTRDSVNNDGDEFLNETDPNKPEETPEFKIPGRININTAPWYVIAQLPWVSYDENDKANPNYRLAQAIVAYRDKLKNPVDYSDPNTGRYDEIKDKIPSTVVQDDIRETAGFASIGELALVLSGSKDEYNEYSIDRLSKDGKDLDDFPDLTPKDKAADDFEERDVIFARISNLVTVRSDVFTAYILVRIGADGPQKRVIAILDRSNVYPPDGGKVRIVALHPVPDPR